MTTTKTGPTIKQLRADIAEATREREAYKRAKQENDDRFMRERDDARDELVRMTAERDEMRAIIDGRKVAPTAAEMVALQRVGGSCTVSAFYNDGSCRVLVSTREGMALMLREAEYVASRGWSVAWRAFDAKGCPCAWPKVTP